MREFADLTCIGGSSHQRNIGPLKAETLKLGAQNKGANKTNSLIPIIHSRDNRTDPSPLGPTSPPPEKGTTSSTPTSVCSGCAQVLKCASLRCANHCSPKVRP